MSGSSRSGEPRTIGELYAELLNINSPLASALHKRMAKMAGYDLPDDEDYHPQFVPYPNTELCIDLKLHTHERGRLPLGKMLGGVIMRDASDHYTFMENARQKSSWTRNPHIYQGDFININRRPDGMVYPTFCRPSFARDYSLAEYCRRAADELYEVAGLVEKLVRH